VEQSFGFASELPLGPELVLLPINYREFPAGCAGRKAGGGVAFFHTPKSCSQKLLTSIFIIISALPNSIDVSARPHVNIEPGKRLVGAGKLLRAGAIRLDYRIDLIKKFPEQSGKQSRIGISNPDSTSQ
jgi:hypothetical protein